MHGFSWTMLNKYFSYRILFAIIHTYREFRNIQTDCNRYFRNSSGKIFSCTCKASQYRTFFRKISSLLHFVFYFSWYNVYVNAIQWTCRKRSLMKNERKSRVIRGTKFLSLSLSICVVLYFHTDMRRTGAFPQRHSQISITIYRIYR